MAAKEIRSLNRVNESTGNTELFYPATTTDAIADRTRQKSLADILDDLENNSGAYDISAAHNNATYADLAAALGTNGANVPAAVRKSGMSVRFVQTSGSKYVQYRYMLADVSTAATFTNVSNWQGVDDEPTAGSNNLVKSGGVYITDIENSAYAMPLDKIRTFNLWLSSSGFVSGSAGRTVSHTIYPVNAGDSVYAKLGTGIFYFAFVKSYAIPEAGDMPDLCENTSIIQIQSGAQTSEYSGNAPADAKYIVIGRYYNGVNRLPGEFTINNYDVVNGENVWNVYNVKNSNFDSEPTLDSGKLVNSGSVKNALIEGVSRNNYIGFCEGKLDKIDGTSHSTSWIPYYMVGGKNYTIKRSFDVDSCTVSLQLKYTDDTTGTVNMSNDATKSVSPSKDVKGIRFTIYGYQGSFSQLTWSVETKDLRTSISELETNKQDKLTFDDVPTSGSNNPVKSGGIKRAIDEAVGKVYETVSVIATADSGSVSSAVLKVKVNGEVVKQGTGSLLLSVEYGKEYVVEAERVYDYLTPVAQTFTAGQSVRNVTCAYTYIARNTITLDQTESDDEAMITGDVHGDVIRAIRAASHLYLGVQTETGNQLICQLKDDDGTKYADGTTAAMDGTEGDQWMKLPVFWWKVTPVGTVGEDGAYDQYQFSFAFAGEPDPSWKKWDGDKNLLGAKEMTVVDGKGYTVSGGQSTGSFTQPTGKTYASARGTGYSLVTWEWQWMMCVLFYAWYGRTNSQAQCGKGSNSYTRTLGTKDSLGMTDTTASNGNSDNTKFWGIENWWGCKYEWMGNVTTNNYVATVVDMNTGESRTVSGWVQCGGTGGWTSRMKVTEHLDFVPTAKDGTETTYFCDWVNANSGSRVVGRSYGDARAGGGVACVNASYASSFSNASVGSRLAFNGVVTEAESVAAYKAALEA